jgi:hypothetical protein
MQIGKQREKREMTMTIYARKKDTYTHTHTHTHTKPTSKWVFHHDPSFTINGETVIDVLMKVMEACGWRNECGN